jgi:hypothetical protein
MAQMELPDGISPTQEYLWRLKAEGLSYQDILTSYSYQNPNTQEIKHLYGKDALTRCFRRTVLGQYWQPWSTGGTDPCLCPDDIKLFLQKIITQTDDLNCLSTIQAKELCKLLQQERLKKAATLLHSIACDGIADSLMAPTSVQTPSSSWLNQICSRVGVSVLKPEEIEQARRQDATLKKLLLSLRLINDFFSVIHLSYSIRMKLRFIQKKFLKSYVHTTEDLSKSFSKARFG